MHDKRPNAMFTLGDLNERATLCYGQMPLKEHRLLMLSDKTNLMLKPKAPFHTALNARNLQSEKPHILKRPNAQQTRTPPALKPKALCH